MFRIGDLELQRLSGPVSFRYLVPKREVFQEKADKKVFLPLIILLGDTHESEENRCDPCDEQKGCYTVESHALLNRIDRIGKRVPVDFYTEYSSHVARWERANVLFRTFHEQTIGCHDTSKRRQPLYPCRYRNVRWHFADARSWELSDKFESFSGKVSRYLEKRGTKPNPIGRYSEEGKMLYEFMKLLRHQDRHIRLPIRWSQKLSTDILNHPKSLINKQLQKYQIDLNVSLFCYRSILESLQIYNVKLENLPLPDDALTALMDYFFKGTPFPQQHVDTLEIVSSIWIWCNSCLLDLYFLGRLFKPPRDNINSYLALGFFGYAHSKTIADFLVHALGWYDLRMESSSENQRCQSVSGVVDLNEDLRAYSETRAAYESLEPHTTALARETSARELEHIVFPPIVRNASIQTGLTDADIKQSLGGSSGRWFQITPVAVEYVNLVAKQIITALVKPDENGVVTLESVITASQSYTGSAFSAFCLPVLRQFVIHHPENLRPAVIQEMARKYVNLYSINRSALAALGRLVFLMLKNLVVEILSDKRQPLLFVTPQRLIDKLAESDKFNQPPLGPFHFAPVSEEVLLLSNDVLTKLSPKSLTQRDVETLNAIANRLVTVIVNTNLMTVATDHPFVTEIWAKSLAHFLSGNAYTDVIPLEAIEHILYFNELTLRSGLTVKVIGRSLSILFRDIIEAAIGSSVSRVVDLGGVRVHHINEPPFGPFDTAPIYFRIEEESRAGVSIEDVSTEEED